MQVEALQELHCITVSELQNLEALLNPLLQLQSSYYVVSVTPYQIKATRYKQSLIIVL